MGGILLTVQYLHILEANKSFFGKKPAMELIFSKERDSLMTACMREKHCVLKKKEQMLNVSD